MAANDPFNLGATNLPASGGIGAATTPRAPRPPKIPGPNGGDPLGGGPTMSPGGGNTGAPLPGSAADGGVGMVPGVPGSVATNPGKGSTAVPPTAQLPQDMSSNINDVRSWVQSRPMHVDYRGDPAAWETAIQQWRQSMPSMFHGFLNFDNLAAYRHQMGLPLYPNDRLQPMTQAPILGGIGGAAMNGG